MKLRLPSFDLSFRETRLAGRMSRLGNRLVRAPYFRGHGVHSPFVYAIVREVFMRKELMEGDRTIYDTLLDRGVSRRRAVQLQNLAIHCGFADFGYDEPRGDLWILSEQVPDGMLLEWVARAAEQRRTVVVLNPYANRERMALCMGIVLRHRSTTVDNRAYLLVFNNHLPKQHFRI